MDHVVEMPDFMQQVQTKLIGWVIRVEGHGPSPKRALAVAWVAGQGAPTSTAVKTVGIPVEEVDVHGVRTSVVSSRRSEGRIEKGFTADCGVLVEFGGAVGVTCRANELHRAHLLKSQAASVPVHELVHLGDGPNEVSVFRVCRRGS